MAAVQASLPLSHFYPETLGSDHLSQNLASSELFTPLQVDRVTVSPARYEDYRSTVEKKARTPWGRLRDYGGLQKIQLPEEFIKLRGYPPEVVQKGHRHYGTGVADARDFPVSQYYDMTSLHKSHVRTSDQVLPPSPDKEMNKRQIDLPFPSEHPYSSHTPRFSLFPDFRSPDDPANGDPVRSTTPLHPNTPASPHKVAVVNKIKGAGFRRELQEYPHEGEKEALTWNGEHDFYQIKKSIDGGRQPYYPTPPKTVHPNNRLRHEDQRLELRSVNALRNIEREQWKTTYDYNYTGNGSSNQMHLDDYHKKMVDEINTGKDSRNNDLIPLTTPSFIPPRPSEGRYARMYQNRSEVKADICYPDANPTDDSPDVMDSREYISLPATPLPLRRKDGWYKTGRKTADPVMKKDKNEESLNDGRLKPTISGTSLPHCDEEDEEQWRILQFQNNPDHGLRTVASARTSKDDLKLTRDLQRLPKTVEELVDLPEDTKYYLKDYQEERDSKFKDIERARELKTIESQYQAKEDMKALRHKVDQMGRRLEPKALDQHAEQVSMDKIKEENLRSSCLTTPERYTTGLKFTTEKISDKGTLTDLHDRQLEGYKEFPTTWRRQIPTVDPPLQNRQGVLSSYVTRSNPFSLSLDAGRDNLGARSGLLSAMSGASTGSILKAPGSPPRSGPSRSISFNEVVRVASSEYGSRFKLSTSPLTNNVSTTHRPSTPLPTPPRSIREPSIHSGTSPTGPALRPSTATDHAHVRMTPRDHWRWSYDTRESAEFAPFRWSPKPGTPYPQSSLMDIQNSWSKSAAHKRLHQAFPETAPDMRANSRHYELADGSADLRFHHSIKHREKRHKFYGFNSYHFYNGNAIL